MALTSVFCFTGCSGEAEVMGITVQQGQEPKTEYVVGQQLDATSGKITVKYSNGTEKVLDMTLATMYIDYSNNSKTNIFTTEAQRQRVVLEYKNKTTEYYVTVSKGTLEISSDGQNCLNNLTAKYDGNAQAVELTNAQLGLPVDIEGIAISYAEFESDQDNMSGITFVETAPTTAGTYWVKIAISGGNNYKDLVTYAKYIIQETCINELTESKNLTIQDFTMQYSDAVDLNANWYDGAQKGTLEQLLGDMANDVVVTCTIKDSEEQDLSKLPVGTYIIQVVAKKTGYTDLVIDNVVVTIIKKQLKVSDFADNLPTSIEAIKNANWCEIFGLTDGAVTLTCFKHNSEGGFDGITSIDELVDGQQYRIAFAISDSDLYTFDGNNNAYVFTAEA